MGASLNVELPIFTGILLTIYCFQLVNGKTTAETSSEVDTSTHVSERSNVATDIITVSSSQALSVITDNVETSTESLVNNGLLVSSTQLSHLATSGTPIGTQSESTSVVESQTQGTTVDNTPTKHYISSISSSLATTFDDLTSNEHKQGHRSEGTTMMVENTSNENSIGSTASSFTKTSQDPLVTEEIGTSQTKGTTVAIGSKTALSSIESTMSSTTMTSQGTLVTTVKIEETTAENSVPSASSITMTSKDALVTQESDTIKTKVTTTAVASAFTESSIVPTSPSVELTSHYLATNEINIGQTKETTVTIETTQDSSVTDESDIGQTKVNTVALEMTSLEGSMSTTTFLEETSHVTKIESQTIRSTTEPSTARKSIRSTSPSIAMTSHDTMLTDRNTAEIDTTTSENSMTSTISFDSLETQESDIDQTKGTTVTTETTTAENFAGLTDSSIAMTSQATLVSKESNENQPEGTAVTVEIRSAESSIGSTTPTLVMTSQDSLVTEESNISHSKITTVTLENTSAENSIGSTASSLPMTSQEILVTLEESENQPKGTAVTVEIRSAESSIGSTTPTLVMTSQESLVTEESNISHSKRTTVTLENTSTENSIGSTASSLPMTSQEILVTLEENENQSEETTVTVEIRSAESSVGSTTPTLVMTSQDSLVTEESNISHSKRTTVTLENTSTENSIGSTASSLPMTSQEILVTLEENEKQPQGTTMVENTSTRNSAMSTASLLATTLEHVSVTEQKQEDHSEGTTLTDETTSTWETRTVAMASSPKTISEFSTKEEQTERTTVIIDITTTLESTTSNVAKTTVEPSEVVVTEKHQDSTTLMASENYVDDTMMSTSIETATSHDTSIETTVEITTFVANKTSVPAEQEVTYDHDGNVEPVTTSSSQTTWEYTSMPFQDSTSEYMNSVPSDATSAVTEVGTRESIHTLKTDEIGAPSESPTTQDMTPHYTDKPTRTLLTKLFTDHSVDTRITSTLLSTIKPDGGHRNTRQTMPSVSSTATSQRSRLSTFGTTRNPSEDLNCSKSCTNGLCMWHEEVQVCACNDGYILDNNQNDLCEDIDECKSSACTGIGEMCMNLPGSYQCNCRAGWQRQTDCIRVDSWKGSLRATTWNNTILSYSLVEDPQSESYNDISSMFTDLLTITYTPDSDFVGVEILGFSEGSIIVNYSLVFNADSEQTEESLTTMLLNSLSFQSDLIVDEDSIQYSDVAECNRVDTNDCAQEATCIEMLGSFTCECLDGYEDTSGPEYGPGRECTVACNIMCENGGNCTHLGTLESVSCSCLDGYSGDHCEIGGDFSSWIDDNAVIVYLSAGAVLFLILLVPCCYLCRGCSKKEKPRVVLTGQSLLSDPFQTEGQDPFQRWHPYLHEKDNPIYKESPPETLTKAPSIESDNDARMQHLVEIMQEDKFKNLLQRKLRVQPRLDLNSEGNSMRSTSWLYEDAGNLPEFSSSSSPTFIRPYVASGNEALELVSVNQAEAAQPQ